MVFGGLIENEYARIDRCRLNKLDEVLLRYGQAADAERWAKNSASHSESRFAHPGGAISDPRPGDRQRRRQDKVLGHCQLWQQSGMLMHQRQTSAAEFAEE